MLALPKIGKKTALKLLNSLNHKISDEKELLDFLQENQKQLRLPEYKVEDFSNINRQLDGVLLKNESNNIKWISYLSKDFPKLLKLISDIPIILNYKGDLVSTLSLPSVAIIGTREPSNVGIEKAYAFGEYFGKAGFNVVSGLAIGCDTGGHKGCLSENGITTALLAHGLDTVYPKQNKELADDILEKGGLLISEYFAGQQALGNFFVERDRLQAGLSLGVIVIETDIKGGTMHTVKFTQESKRLLYAYKHEDDMLNFPKSLGNQKLLNENLATPIDNLQSLESSKTSMLNLQSVLLNSLPIETSKIRGAKSKNKNLPGIQLTIDLK